jgi:putative redox protein
MAGAQQRVVKVAESGSGPYSQIVTAGSHTLSADEPQAVGGNDVGPSPYEYILAGLGACTAMTLRSYVTRHNWGVNRITIELRHEKIVAAGGTSTVDQFRRVIHLEGNVSGEQRLKLLEIAESCVVSQMLRRASTIESKLADNFEPSPA